MRLAGRIAVFTAAAFAVICPALLSAAERDVLRAAGEMLARGSFQEAEAELTKYVAMHPDSADGQRLLGISLALVPRRSAALEALQQAVRLKPEDPINRLAFAQVLSRFGDNPGAKREFEAALELDPRLSAAHEGLALALALDGEIEPAIQHFSAAIEHTDNPRLKARLHYLRGKAWNQQEKAELAAKDFDVAIGLDAELGPAYLELGRILANAPEDARGAKVIEKAVELLPESFDAYALLGNYYLRTGRAESAITPLRRAAELNPADRATAYALGRALRQAGREEEARAYLKQLAQATGGRASSEAEISEAGRLNNQALELEKRGDYEQALGRYRDAMAIAPEEIGFRRNAALVLCRLNRWAEAKIALREVLDLSPGDVDATKALYLALEHAPDTP